VSIAEWIASPWCENSMDGCKLESECYQRTRAETRTCWYQLQPFRRAQPFLHSRVSVTGFTFQFEEDVRAVTPPGPQDR